MLFNPRLYARCLINCPQNLFYWVEIFDPRELYKRWSTLTRVSYQHWATIATLSKQSNFSSSLTCLRSVLLVRIQDERVSKASNVMVVFVGNIVLVELESPSVITVLPCKLVLPSIGAVADESSILEPLPAPVENDSSFAVTFQILEDCTTKGKPKLIDSRGYCYNIKRRRANATDWQCTVRPEVAIVKLSYAVFSWETFSTTVKTRRGQTYCPADPPCFRQETQKNPKTEVPWLPDQTLRLVGWIRGQRTVSQAVAESLLLPERTEGIGG